MPLPENVMQVFALLEKTNCRQCGEKTCLAFAGAVFKGEKKISECPFLGPDIVGRFSKDNETDSVQQEDTLEMLKQQFAGVDLAEAAKRIGGIYRDGRLTVKVMGKDLSVDQDCNFYSSLHVNHWLTVPFLTYIIGCRGVELTGNWMSFREIPGGKERYPLFQKRCEEGMKRVADVYTDLFDDMAHLFQGNQVKSKFDSDISVVLSILPKAPMMICYWKPDDGMASSLNLFFDSSVGQNLGCDSAYTLGAGMTQMFEKLALRHGCVIHV